jgi:hypothetical protein
MAVAADTPIIALFISSSSSDPLMAAWLSPPTQVSHFQANLPNFQQRVRHVNRRQRPTPLPSRTAKSRHQAQLGVDGVDVRAWSSRQSVAGQVDDHEFAIGLGDVVASPCCLADSGKHADLCQHGRHVHVDRLA